MPKSNTDTTRTELRDGIKPKDISTLIKCGVYMLIHNNKIVYVDKSTNILSKLMTHLMEKKKTFDSYDYIECAERKLDKIEQSLIEKYKPIYNIINNNEIVIEKGKVIDKYTLSRLFKKIVTVEDAITILKKLNKGRHLRECDHKTAIVVNRTYKVLLNSSIRTDKQRADYIHAVKQYIKEYPTWDN